ncbi:MAG: hypothetical protein JWP96_1467 [Polaromonas sp.]|nr:hypothetical protein [Polaromonas sp.]
MMENSTFNPGLGSTDYTGDADMDLASTDSKNTVDKVANPAHDTVDRLSSVAHQAVDKVAGSVAGVADRFSDQARWISETPPRVLEASKSWVQEKPLEAVGIALAVGYVIGRLRS